MKVQKVLHLHIEEKKKKPNINHTYIVTPKLDGWFGYIDYIDGEWSNIHSRVGREIPSLLWARQEFQELAIHENVRLIFEITIPNEPFHILNGILNRSVGDCQAREAIFHLHDIISYSFNFSARDRLHRLLGLDLETVKYHIRRIPVLAITEDKEVWMDYFNEVTNAGGEGVVLKQLDAVYQPDKRNSSLMKIKLEDTFDLECINIFHTVGDKGYDNLNATLRRKSGVIITVRIPKDEDRILFEENPMYIIGNIVEVKCMCELPDGKLREPRFVRVRDDKYLEDRD
jgi:ATP-dependent DNA ligase